MPHRHEDDDAEYRQDEQDMRDAGYRKVRDPRGGYRMIRRYPQPDPSEEFFG